MWRFGVCGIDWEVEIVICVERFVYRVDVCWRNYWKVNRWNW